jgi:hypothetical protein
LQGLESDVQILLSGFILSDSLCREKEGLGSKSASPEGLKDCIRMNKYDPIQYSTYITCYVHRTHESVCMMVRAKSARQVKHGSRAKLQGKMSETLSKLFEKGKQDNPSSLPSSQRREVQPPSPTWLKSSDLSFLFSFFVWEGKKLF